VTGFIKSGSTSPSGDLLASQIHVADLAMDIDQPSNLKHEYSSTLELKPPTAGSRSVILTLLPAEPANSTHSRFPRRQRSWVYLIMERNIT